MSSEVYTISQALDKAMKYCAYQERCQMEVRNKLRSFQLTEDQREEVIAELISQNFLNEERFSESFARGKFNIKGWGKKKIVLALRQKDISDYCIKKGLQQIDEEEYLPFLSQLIEKSFDKYDGVSNYQQIAKTAQYVIGRGFEPHLVWQELKSYTND